MKIKGIITGASALYKQGLISYSPTFKHVEMIIGTNTTSYGNEFKITLQKHETIDIGVIEIDGDPYYCPERLFVELGKFKLESTIKSEAIKKLKEKISPEKTKKIYEELKKHRRGLNKEMIEDFLEENLLNVKELVRKSKDIKMIIREYIMALVSRDDVPVSLIKGGSSVELFTSINRTTLDIDAHTDKKSINEIIEILTNREMDIYFHVSEADQEKIASIKNSINSKRVIKINLHPISRGGVLSKELKDIIIPISFNTTYSDDELDEIVNIYKITKRRLKHLEKSSAIIFSREMLLAEKFQSLISKPENTKRTKDLIDLKLLWSDEINFNDFRKWLYRKWENQKASLTPDLAKQKIIDNREKELTKVLKNFDDAVSMYGADISQKECLDIYELLIKEALK